MATRRWIGGAPAVAQVTGYIFGGTWEADDVIYLTIGTKTARVTAGSTSIPAILDAVVAAWNALSSTTYPEFAEITASRSGNQLILTGDTPGRPFACTVSTSETDGGAADDQTIDGAASSTGTDLTPCAGPNHWDTPANWDDGTVPVTGDDVYLEDSSFDILYGLGQSAVTLASLNIAASFTGKIGLPNYSTSGTTYYEYRPKYLAISATVCNIGKGIGGCSQRIKLDFGSNPVTLNVEGTASPESANVYALMVQGSHASNVLNAVQGNIGLAAEVNAAAQFPTIRVGYETSPGTDVTLFCGAGCTLGTILQTGGIVTVNSDVTGWTKTAGTATLLGSATVGTLTNDAGTFYWQSNGTITTGTFRGQGSVLDCSRDNRGRTLTSSQFTDGAVLIDPAKTITFTNPFVTDKTSLRSLALGEAPFTLQRS
jgi:hypothetical protein